MRYIVYTKKISDLKYFIEKGRVKTPTDIVKKLNVSERTVSRLIRDLKETGIDVKFCRIKNCYKII